MAISIALAILTVAPCGQNEKKAESPVNPYDNASGIDFTTFDKNVRPQDDFFKFVNGGWIATAEIPGDQPWWGVVPKLFEKSANHQREIVEDMAKKTDSQAGTIEQQIGDFYKSLINTSLVDGKGVAPVASYLAEIDKLRSKNALTGFFGRANYLGIKTPIICEVHKDTGDPTRALEHLYQGGLGLPDRDYYLDKGDEHEKLRVKYRDYIVKLFTLAGFDNPDARAGKTIAIEYQLAKAHWSVERSRDVKATYNLVAVRDLKKISPQIAWDELLKGAGVSGEKEIIVAQPSYYQVLGNIITGVPLEDWKNYLRFQTLNATAPYLSSEFKDAEFQFNQRLVGGLQEKTPRWKTAVTLLDQYMGEAVGRVYVTRYFSKETKVGAERLVTNLLEAFRVGIQNLEWMSPETKAKAEEKRSLIKAKIGYPDKWRDYSGLRIVAADPIGNLMRANTFTYQYNLNRLGKPVDTGMWFKTPQTIAAYYDQGLNEIVFPAAILQPPFFNPKADAAVNYGAIGAMIGHEIGHAFDDQGRKFNGHGRLVDWWTAGDSAKFEALTKRLVDQYNQFTPIEGLHVNGRLTLGENIGDLTGVSIAYAAYKKSLNGKEAPIINGYTGDQRFFIGYAQCLRAKFSEEVLREMVTTDPHSPFQYVVIGVLRNFTPFYAAFGVKPGDGMYLAPEERVKIW
ncbi:MAG: M13 family metallopeptidase [Pyrinomonadaceae bacterium]